MAIDFKGIFRNKNHWQRKINSLGWLESRRWVKTVTGIADRSSSAPWRRRSGGSPDH